MNNKFEYSVVIRTLGTSGEKFEQLLKSVEQQTISPKEVLVVIPYGFTPPSYIIDKERVVFTRKGMVNQRQVGIEEAVSDYLLVLDDDIAFPENFVKRMFDKMQLYGADAIAPKGTSSTKHTQYGLNYWKYLLLGQKRYSKKECQYYMRIGRTGGTIVNIDMKNDVPHWCQTANFQCFFIKRDCALNTHLEDEMWLETTGYALPDDQVFFYKLFLNGGKILFTPDINYIHLDAKAGNNKTDKLYRDYYTTQRNYTIFWYKFLFTNAKSNTEKMLLRFCLFYRMFAQSLFFIAKCIVKHRVKLICKWGDGYKDAFSYINSYKKYDT